MNLNTTVDVDVVVVPKDDYGWPRTIEPTADQVRPERERHGHVGVPS